MTALILVLVVLTAGAVVWLALEVLRLRRGAGAGPVREAAGLPPWVEEVLADLDERVADLEARLPAAIRYVGTVAYDAYGDAAGALSRSVALLSEEGSGVVVSHLVGRTESRFFLKGVVEGRGREPLSPEEEEAVRRALTG